MTKTFRYQGRYYTREELINILNEVLWATLKATKLDAINWINTFVPKRTGQLRDSLIDWINARWIKTETGIQISLGTDVIYAFEIEGDVRHAGTWFEHSGSPATAYYYNNYGKVYLDDPQAFLKWQTLIGSYITEVFNTHLLTYKDTFLGGG